MQFTLTVKGLNESIKAVDSLEDRVGIACETFMFKVISHITERAQANAPIFSGDLRAALVGYIANSQVAGMGISKPPVHIPKRTVIKGKVVDTMSYALKMHESVYKLGRISSMQPGTVEGGVGRKYISRIVRYHTRAYQKGLQKLIEGWLPAKAKIRVEVKFPT